MSVSIIPGVCLRHRYSSTSLRISLLHVEFYPPLTYSSSAVKNAVPKLSSGISHLSFRTACARFTPSNSDRSEEHTSELQSLMRISYAVFCLKKKTTTNPNLEEPHPTTTLSQTYR